MKNLLVLIIFTFICCTKTQVISVDYNNAWDEWNDARYIYPVPLSIKNSLPSGWVRTTLSSSTYYFRDKQYQFSKASCIATCGPRSYLVKRENNILCQRDMQYWGNIRDEKGLIFSQYCGPNLSGLSCKSEMNLEISGCYFGKFGNNKCCFYKSNTLLTKTSILTDKIALYASEGLLV